MVGREHGAEARGDRVELGVPEGQRLRVGDDPLHLHTAFARFPLACRQALRRQIGGDDGGSGLRGADRDVAGAGGDVEHTLSGPDPGRRHELRTDAPDHLFREPVVVAERPDGARSGRLSCHRSSDLRDSRERGDLGDESRGASLHSLRG